MDRLKEKITSLKLEADTNNERATAAEAKLKQSQDQLRENEQALITATNKQRLLEQELSRLEGRLQDAQGKASQQANNDQEIDNLKRKIKLLEQESSQKESQLQSTTAKLHEVEGKAQDFERKALSLDAFKLDLEKKNADLEAKYLQTKQDLEHTLATLEDF